MSIHNDLNHRATLWLLHALRSGTPAWSLPELTPAVTIGSSFQAWPQPDQTFFDSTTNRQLAVEFKPPGHGKREYVTGLGQCLTYLNSFDYVLLVTPRESIDGFAIAEYLGETVRMDPLLQMPLGILAYGTDPLVDMAAIEGMRPRLAPVSAPASQRKAFWGYWRDLSQYDVFALLDLTYTLGVYDKAWKRYWDKQLGVGKAQMWDGTYRKAWSPKSNSSASLNSSLALRHAGLISSDGLLTLKGLELLQLGKVYTPSSLAFTDTLARRVLGDSRHLELIYWIYELQGSLPAHNTAADYLLLLEDQLIAEGVIHRPPAGGKPAYIRDEPKLWNALGLLTRRTKQSYYWPGVGLIFDWRRITAIVAADL